MASQSDSDSVFFHEDDYCQIEILPAANREFCKRQAGAIESFAEAHRDGEFYTDIYLRDQNPAPFSSVGLNKESLASMVGSLLPARTHVITGYSSYRVAAERTIAFGAVGQCLFADYDEAGVVQNLWLDLGPGKPECVSQMAEALAAISVAADLLLVDWTWNKVLDLGDAAGIKEYLQMRLGRRSDEAGHP